MNKYRIVYSVKGSETIDPLCEIVEAYDEEGAVLAFSCIGKWYSTNDFRKLTIESIRKI